MVHKKGNCHDHAHCNGSILEELICHTPYAILSVAVGLIVLSFLSYGGLGKSHGHGGLHTLFHSFHFLHILFATAGSLVTFSRFSSNMIKGFIVSLLSALFFCTLSDVILPYVAGRMLGVAMHFHICFIEELHNIIPFLGIGLLNGFIASKHAHATKGYYSVIAHSAHILTSSLASLFYMVGEGFVHWHEQMGLLYIVLLIVVVIPCTLADVIVPVFFAQTSNDAKKHTDKSIGSAYFPGSRKVNEEHTAGKH